MALNCYHREISESSNTPDKHTGLVHWNPQSLYKMQWKMMRKIHVMMYVTDVWHCFKARNYRNMSVRFVQIKQSSKTCSRDLMYCQLLPGRLANTKREEVSAESLGTLPNPRNNGSGTIFFAPNRVDDEFQFSLQGWQFSTGTL